jgi:hypothetical protein
VRKAGILRGSSNFLVARAESAKKGDHPQHFEIFSVNLQFSAQTRNTLQTLSIVKQIAMCKENFCGARMVTSDVQKDALSFLTRDMFGRAVRIAKFLQ